MTDAPALGRDLELGASDPRLPRQLKVGVFVVAYNATTTIREVLSRIRSESWDRISEVFIFDDSSADDTAEVATQYKRDLHLDKVRVFRNQVNLGYGGNQKRGYRYAIENDFDIVVLLHGDGQYAPEVMDDLIDPIARGEADAVFGSRMLLRGQALRGGMPLYKFLGNRLLTRFQNLLMGRRMSEYHSGYRAYNVHALRQIPFMKDSNDFHFDNEIIVQLHYAGLRIKEVPIPTFYGDEICYVNGIAYGWNVIKTIILYRLHRAGLLYARQFDLRGGAKYAYKSNRYSSHSRILQILQAAAKGSTWRVLNIGWGSGFLARHITSMGHLVVGVDLYDNSEAREVCAEFIVADIEKDFGLGPDEQFDCIILADVLEHTRDPEGLLLRARRHLKPDGCLIASTGNVANAYVRLKLFMGDFTYTERGILDSTHYHLFTRRSFANLLRECGFRIARTKATPIPFESVIPGQPLISESLSWLNMLAARIDPSLFAYQTVIQAVPDSKATELLRRQQIADAHYSEYVAAAVPDHSIAAEG